MRHHPAAGQLKLRFRGPSGFKIALPPELWGAASLALRMCATKNGEHIGRAARAVTQALSAPSFAPAPEYPTAVAEALDYTPTLTSPDDAACLALSASLCVAVYLATAPAAFSMSYAAGMAIIFATCLFLSRGWLLERHYKALQRPERELAAKGSKFLSVEGAEVHYKRSVAERAAPVAPAVHCLHGFGASAYSWSFIQQGLAQRLGGVVTAHDMPGFGLSQRPWAERYYTLGYNGTAARDILEAEIASLGAGNGANGTDANGRRSSKRVLIGHSMGGAAVAEAIIQNPEGISGVVLVAPAIVAFWAGVPEGALSDPVATGAALIEEFVSPEDPPGILESSNSDGTDSPTSSSSSLSSQPSLERGQSGDAPSPVAGSKRAKKASRKKGPNVFRIVAAIVQAVLLEVVRLGLLAATPLLVLALRKAVRSRRFWERGLASAWTDKSRITRQYVDGYRYPQLVRGWEGGMLRFLRGRFSEKAGLVHAIASALQPGGHLSQAERLAAACRAHGIPVLLVHGTEDVLVPVQNSRRLAKVISGARLVEFTRCGHMPHEESAERFIEEVAAFVEGL